jgi:molybdenum cofactor cytidylyltransferase
MVCDQPLLTTDHLNVLIQTFKKTKSQIVASHYSGGAGVPALFDKSLFEELLNLENESGAKKIIQQHKDVVYSIPFPEGAIDLDTPDDYEKFIKGKD